MKTELTIHNPHKPLSSSWSLLSLSLPPSQTPSWSWPLTIPLTRFGFEDEYYDGSVSWWQHTKPRIWSAFDEPYSSNFAKVNQLSDEWYFETNCVGGSLPFFAFPYTGCRPYSIFTNARVNIKGGKAKYSQSVWLGLTDREKLSRERGWGGWREGVFMMMHSFVLFLGF